jgi:hypothetical protein
VCVLVDSGVFIFGVPSILPIQGNTNAIHWVLTIKDKAATHSISNGEQYTKEMKCTCMRAVKIIQLGGIEHRNAQEHVYKATRTHIELRHKGSLSLSHAVVCSNILPTLMQLTI